MLEIFNEIGIIKQGIVGTVAPYIHYDFFKFSKPNKIEILKKWPVNNQFSKLAVNITSRELKWKKCPTKPHRN